MQYSSDAERFEMALKTPLSGYFTSGHSWSQDNEGHFWSSTWHNDKNMKSLAVTYNNVYSSTSSSYRTTAYSVRCVFDES